ncbi:MAG: S8 family peptidase [Acidimicrobiales bacterium]
MVLGALLFGLASWPGLLDNPVASGPATSAATTTAAPATAGPAPAAPPAPAHDATSALPTADPAAARPDGSPGTDPGQPGTATDHRSLAADVAALRPSGPGETVDVLVRLNVAVDAGESVVQDAARQLNEQLGVTASMVHGAGVVSLPADAAALDRLAGSPLVAAIEADQWLAPALDRSTAQIGAPAAWAAGFTGAGRTVAIIDSGVESTHPALAGKVRYEACFSNVSCPNGAATMVGPGAAAPCVWGAGCEHGTHVAGVIAAGPATTAPTTTTPATTGSPPTTVANPALPQEKQRGVAPGVGLVAMQVFSQSTSAGCAPAPTCPRARTSDVLLALDHVLQLVTTNALAQPIVAVNLSLASDVTLVSCNDSILAPAIDRLWAAGVATVIAAGNGSSTTRLSIPACITSSVSVGALDQAGNAWTVSNSSPSLDFFAPGVGVVATWPGARWQASSGTSTAAPHVAGAWALASQALGSTDPALIDSWLRRQPNPLDVGGVNVARLSVAALASLAAPAPPTTRVAAPALPAGPGLGPFTDGLPVPVHPRTQPELVPIDAAVTALSPPDRRLRVSVKAIR